MDLCPQRTTEVTVCCSAALSANKQTGIQQAMKLLLFSDLHADTDAARHLVEMARTADVLIGAGDFGNMRREIHDCIDILQAVAKPAVLVPGNAESAEELADACRDWPSARVLHGSGVRIDGVDFFGVGGAIPVTPFGSWSYDFSEDEATQLLSTCPSGGVLVTHSPPRGAVDRSSKGQNLGSSAVREVVERCRPKLVVCGHIHGSWAQRETISPTTVINAGPAGIEWIW
jgi:Icc-related predicted phosphoesterase